MCDEVLACERHELRLGRVIDDLDAYDVVRRFGSVLLAVRLERGGRGASADDQHFLHAGQGVGDVAVELVLGAHGAAMLGGVVRVRFDLLGLYMLGIELQHLRALVVDADDGVEGCHELCSFWVREAKLQGDWRPYIAS